MPAEYKTIGELDAAAALQTADLIELEQSGVSKKITVEDIETHVYDNLPTRKVYEEDASWTVVPESTDADRSPIDYTFLCTGGTNGIRATLDTTGWQEGDRLTFIREDFVGATAVTIYSSELIGGVSYLFLIYDKQTFTLERKTGNTWGIISGVKIADSGHINTSQWDDRNLAMRIPYDNKSAGTILIGEKVTEETSNNKWLVVADDGSTLDVWMATGGGVATDGRELTFSQSGVTADVNYAPSTKNIDYDFYHGFATSISNLDCSVFLSSAGSEATTRELVSVANNNSSGIVFRGVADFNHITVQTEANRVLNLSDSGVIETWDTEDYCFRIIVKEYF